MHIVRPSCFCTFYTCFITKSNYFSRPFCPSSNYKSNGTQLDYLCYSNIYTYLDTYARDYNSLLLFCTCNDLAFSWTLSPSRWH